MPCGGYYYLAALEQLPGPQTYKGPLLSSVSQVIFALNQTLLQQESLRAGSLQIPYTTEDLIKHYNCGDLSSVIFSHGSSQVSTFPCQPPCPCLCRHSIV